MNHSRIRRSVWTFVAGLLSIFGVEIAAQDPTPIEDADLVVYETDFSSHVDSAWLGPNARMVIPALTLRLRLSPSFDSYEQFEVK